MYPKRFQNTNRNVFGVGTVLYMDTVQLENSKTIMFSALSDRL